MSKQGINVTWEGNYDFLTFTFPAFLDKKSAEKAIDIWDKEFALQPRGTDLIWDCTEMTDYDPMARMLWQKALTNHKNQINTIWLISESAIIRAGAKLFSLFVGVTIKPVKSHAEITATAAVAA